MAGGALAEPGDVLAGKYRIVRPSENDGWGVVLAAYHELIDRSVESRSSDLAGMGDSVARLVNEARAAS